MDYYVTIGLFLLIDSDDKIKNSTKAVNNQKVLGSIVSVSIRPFLSSRFLEQNPIIYTIRYTEVLLIELFRKPLQHFKLINYVRVNEYNQFTHILYE